MANCKKPLLAASQREVQQNRFEVSVLISLAQLAVFAKCLRTWGEEQAIRCVDDLETCCQMLADNPELGRACEDVRPGLRRMERGEHVVFYRADTGGILVSRILHQRMLPEGHAIDNDDGP